MASQLQSLLFHMLRRIPQVHTLPNTLHPPVPSRPYKPSPNNSTDESADQSLQTRACKEKSQLCKRFMENGYCPYQKRCKFAHGSEELRRNDQQNFKYKTKECGSFKNHQFCVYGDRCNFIHITTPPRLVRTNPEEEESGPDVEMGMIRSLGAKSSRLMGKLF